MVDLHEINCDECSFKGKRDKYTALVFVFNAGARELKVVFNEMWREEGLMGGRGQRLRAFAKIKAKKDEGSFTSFLESYIYQRTHTILGDRGWCEREKNNTGQIKMEEK